MHVFLNKFELLPGLCLLKRTHVQDKKGTSDIRLIIIPLISMMGNPITRQNRDILEEMPILEAELQDAKAAYTRGKKCATQCIQFHSNM